MASLKLRAGPKILSLLGLGFGGGTPPLHKDDCISFVEVLDVGDVGLEDCGEFLGGGVYDVAYATCEVALVLDGLYQGELFAAASVLDEATEGGGID